MYKWHHRNVRTRPIAGESFRMSKGWKMVTAAAGAGLLLVGCSLLSAQHRPEPGNAVETHDPAPLEPGVAHVTVGRVSAAEATIWWKSPYQGQTTIVYGRDPHLVPVVVERTAPTSQHTTELTDLEPGTRYYFQVETATPLGVARSAIISFRTADAAAPVAANAPTLPAPAVTAVAKTTVAKGAPRRNTPRRGHPRTAAK